MAYLYHQRYIRNQASNYNIWNIESNSGSLGEVFEFFGKFSFALCYEHDGPNYDSIEVTRHQECIPNGTPMKFWLEVMLVY